MAVVAHNLHRSFGQNHAVVDASFTLEPGTITALVGPNGCGKTTTMLMLAGLLNPDSGWVSVDDQVISSADPSQPYSPRSAARARSLMGWMPDEFGSWPALRCLEVLEAFAGFYQVPNPRARAQEVLREFGMEAFANERLITLSRGQKQRLGLARTLLHSPKYLILDEPSNGMDPAARRDLRVLLRELAAEGRAILISSHVLVELNDVADNAIMMRAGRVVSEEMDTWLRWRIEILNPDRWVDYLGGIDAAKWGVQTGGGQPASSFHEDGPRGRKPDAVRMAVQQRTPAPERKLTVTFCAESEREAAQFVSQACAAGVLISRLEALHHDLEQRYLEIEGAHGQQGGLR